MEEKAEKTVFDKIRYCVNLLYSAVGCGVWGFLLVLMFRYYILNLLIISFFFWLGLYFVFARNFVNDIKQRKSWGDFRKKFSIALVRAPMTAINLLFIYIFLYEDFLVFVPYLLWGCFLAAWSIFPVNALIDYMEKKLCS